jgi:flavin-binding protein dodecin
MSEAKSSYDALMEWLYAIHDARKEAGETVDTVEWLTEIYEGRGYSHEDAVRLANGETLPEDTPHA